MSDLNLAPYVQLELFPDPDENARSARRHGESSSETEQNSSELPPDYWLKVSNKLMKKLDRELKQMPPAMQKATVSEILHLLAQML